MKLTREQVRTARSAMRQYGHCSTRNCGCHFCIAAQALRVYERLLEYAAARKLNPPPMSFGEYEWLTKIEKWMEVA